MACRTISDCAFYFMDVCRFDSASHLGSFSFKFCTVFIYKFMMNVYKLAANDISCFVLSDVPVVCFKLCMTGSASFAVISIIVCCNRCFLVIK